jgi:hypothetical protein
MDACPTPSAATLDDVNTLKEILADTDSIRVDYRRALGLSGVAPDSLVPVTDRTVCRGIAAAVHNQ